MWSNWLVYWSNIGISKNDIAKLTKDDVLIICSGANDMKQYNSLSAYNQIVNFINRLSHTITISLSVPLRYDLPASSFKNRKTESSNRKSMELKLRFFYGTFSEINHIRH